ncbi:glycine betaine uptake BCCT transporter [Saccharococcus caldoxylosilyticus]|uniref:Glycine betaine transporter n=1 Tax=Parageobacillus caldoxylosilyticus NBRC 107762 TaxID=1220594 RepID=A0A023DHU1_9BACL|nr:BCCT family transporter [Parageobacillus caldoxylosilyticus]OQP04088.1 glycine/betaine ABC transporter permease [Geobacillus sp. 44B]MBB3853966.1 glycine betaine transporter [Parageobacillus caldoxylosilyticus]QNU37668.1 BCCT family transporter [Geobacillus sp. 44B]QXJ37281.1 Glycine betaine transporter OpuD [Parageobacillus caldoxylosilyticus]GAJ40840.1 glycine betaine transporter [Parageobacillus caldoxylosilyticus NBRC 107762]
MRKVSTVFYISIIIVILFIIWGVIPASKLPDYNLGAVSTAVHSFLIDRFGWFYLLAATTFLVFCLFLIFSKYGNIRLGEDDEKPEYSSATWFAMLFSAGMGIGLVFWGVAEPISHYHTPPAGEGGTPEAARLAMRYAFFHWGLHPWAIYGVIALALAYFQFRKKEPGVISRLLRPIFGDKVNGAVGITIDTLSVYATIFGVATSLGLGAIQIGGGLSRLFPAIPNNFITQLIIIIVVTFLFMTSAQTGLNKGIKILSDTNIALAVWLMLFLLFVGPTSFIMDVFTTTIGTYLQNLPSMSFRLTPFEQSDWPKSWTIFYWAWWIAWAPFVGTFIARISRGRTIREFMIGVLAVPTVFSALWFSVFGGSALYLERFQHISIIDVMNDKGMETALFFMLQQFPFGTILSGLAILLICTFFVTSADSATFVLGMQTTNGMLNPPNSVKFIWGIAQSAAAVILLWTGGLQALQTASIVAAFPFAIIMILIVISLIRSFQKEPIAKKRI